MIAVEQGDARVLADALRELRFAACITDPPYSAHVHEKAYNASTIASGGPALTRPDLSARAASRYFLLVTSRR